MTWIQTCSGGAIDLHPPQPESLVLSDLVFAVSHLARFTGHFGSYMVAQHLVLGARALRDEGHAEGVQRAFLGHDLHEAICGDVSSPAKRVMRKIHRDTVRAVLNEWSPYSWEEGDRDLDSYVAEHPDPWTVYEAGCALAVRIRFGFPREMPDAVHMADLRMLETERRDLTPHKPPRRWLDLPDPYPFRITKWSADRCLEELTEECVRLGVA